MASYDVDFSIRASLDQKSAEKVEREIEKTAKSAEKSFRKVRTALEVSQGKQGQDIKAQRDKLGINETNVKTAYAAVQKYVDQLNKVAEIETEINKIRSDPARQKDIANTQARLRTATKSRDKYAAGTDEYKKYQDKIDKETEHLKNLKEQLAPLEEKLQLNKGFANDLKQHLGDVVTQFKKAEKPASEIFRLLGISVTESDQLAATAAKAGTGLNATAAAADGLAKTEAKATTEKTKSIATTKEEDNSLSALLKRLAEYREELAKTSNAGKDTAAIEQKIADTADKINSKFVFSSATDGIANLVRRMQELQAAKRALENAGIPSGFESQYSYIFEELTKAKVAINDYTRRLKETASASDQAGASGRRFAQTTTSALRGTKNELLSFSKNMQIIKSRFSGLQKTAGKVKSAFDNMARNMRSNFKHMITNMTKYVLGFRSLFFLVRRLRKYLGEGIQNLVQFESGANPVNEAITDMLSSLLYLKNAWAAAFAPVIMYVRPILVSLIDMLAEVGNAVARFLSFILQSEVTFNAVRVSAGDYAESLGGVGDSAGGAADKVKKLTDRLAAFDDLNVLGKDNDDDTDGTGGGGGGGASDLPNFNDMFEIVDAEENEFLKRLKESWSTADFTWLGELLRDKIIEGLDWLNSQWDTIQEYASKIGHSLGSFLVGLLGEPELWEKSGHAIGEAVNTINIAISSFLDELDKIPFGENAGKGVNEFLHTTDWELAGENINRVITGITDNISAFIDTLDAEAIANAITEFVKGVNIPDIAVSVGNLVFKAGKLIVEVIGNLILNTSDYFANLLAKWVSSPVPIAYVDKDGVHVKFGFDLKTDWTEHPILAFFERVAMAIGANITQQGWKIAVGFGFEGDYGDYVEFADKLIQEPVESFGLIFDNLFNSANKTTEAIDQTTNSVNNLATTTETATGTITNNNAAMNEFATATDNANTSVSTLNTTTAQTSYHLNYATGELITTTESVDNMTGSVDTMNNAFVDAATSVGTYSSTVEMYIRQNDQTISNSADVTTQFGNDVATATGTATESFSEFNGAVIDAGDSVVSTVLNVGDETGKTVLTITGDFSDMADGVSESTGNLSTTVNEAWELLNTDIPVDAQLMGEEVYNAFLLLEENTTTSWTNIKNTIIDNMTEAKTQGETQASNLNTTLSRLFLNTKDDGTRQFRELKDNIVGSFEDLAEEIKNPANSFLYAIEQMVNHATDALNDLIDNVNAALDMGTEWLNYMGLPNIGKMEHVPPISVTPLAQGAVIPPNREFLALLGDQSHGTNIEAPLDTIKQAVAEVLATNNSNGEVVELLQELIRVVEDKDLTIGDKEIGKANARYVNKQRLIRGTSF